MCSCHCFRLLYHLEFMFNVMVFVSLIARRLSIICGQVTHVLFRPARLTH